VPDDKGEEEVEEYGSRTDDDASGRSSSASEPHAATRVPNFLPATSDELEDAGHDEHDDER